MAFGMGFVFVPLTLTAVHGVSDNDQGIGSGVLNAMQQVGGSLGLATLSTIFVSAFNDKLDSVTAAAAKLSTGGAAATPDERNAFGQAVYEAALAFGSTRAFLVGAAMIWAGALITLLFMNVKHEEINGSVLPGAPTEVD